MAWQIEAEVREHSNSKGAAMDVLLFYASLAPLSTRVAYADVAKVAEKTKRNRRTVQRSLRLLEELGELLLLSDRRGGFGLSPRYLVLPALATEEQLEAALKRAASRRCRRAASRPEKGGISSLPSDANTGNYGGVTPPEQLQNERKNEPPNPPEGGSQDLEASWEEIRQLLRSEVTDFTWHVWLQHVELVPSDGSARLELRAPGHIRTWIEERYADLIQNAATRVAGAHVAVTWEHALLETEQAMKDALLERGREHRRLRRARQEVTRP